MREHLDWIYQQQSSMVKLLEAWANINSGTDNLPGLAKMLRKLKESFKTLKGTIKEIPLPPRIAISSSGHPHKIACGSALWIRKRPEAPYKILLAGHMDTVYQTTSEFQKVDFPAPEIMRGPGVTDMKGGLIVLLTALQALERTPYAEKIGWEVLINPDEEVGSPSSEFLFVQAAQRNQIGLLYEPSFSDGAIVGARKGSMNFVVVVKGRSAHAGRDFHSGRNAISALSRFIIAVEEIMKESKEITLNIGHVEGGGATNIVPDLAIGRFNLRMTQPNDLAYVQGKLSRLIDQFNQQDGISITLVETSSRGPKPFDSKNSELFNLIQSCGKELGLKLDTRSSGGVCDGNILSSAGLPTIDTLGVIGSNIHTPDESIVLSSLSERAALSAYFLLQVAAGKIELPCKEAL